ncbi:uncharacterized protein SRS1_06406 [Sporisorium reilianum f. sp. reilianum]|uniref:Uncharacterized protein n=1 Tax=Sporisorium reilianum f. sp. reilianum TaxID=72559 RepID=A0A2N8U5Z0_9BASI|nr:uncharacterized protein SRS1_06406 [Sporisorium reilianum f. sp. reilianum]
MRKLVLFLLTTLALSLVVQAHPTPYTNENKETKHRDRQRLVAREAPLIEKPVSTYKAVSKWEDKKNIALVAGAALGALVTFGLVGMRLTEHLACRAVSKQERTMQAAWDEVHKDGFTPSGDGVRPATFDCNTQERGFKPIKSYASAAEWY